MHRAKKPLFALLLLLAGCGPARVEDPVETFRKELAEALARRDAAALRELLPAVSAEELTGWARGENQNAHAAVRLLDERGEAPLVFVHIEQRGAGGTVVLYQSFGELGARGSRVSLARTMPLAEAARAFRIASHRSGVRIEADSGDTAIVDEVELEVAEPTRRVFFLLDAGREITRVSIAAGDADVTHVANFVLLERSEDWPAGARVWLEVHSRARIVRLPKA